MAFSINTNLGALQAYNALAKTNAETQKAQLRLATQKKINSVADDTSGFNIGKQMQAQVLKQQAQLNNVSSAQNYLATSESALQQINDKLNSISAKYTDAQDPLKDQTSIAKDISTLATEIKSILQTTNINGTQLLVSQVSNTAAGTAKTFDLGGNAFSVDFATDATMGTTALFTKISNLTLSDSSVDAAGAIAAGKTAARAYVSGTFVPAVLAKMTEKGLTAAQGTTFSTTMLACYDAAITAGQAIGDAFESALTTAEAAVGGGSVVSAINQGTTSQGTAAYVEFTHYTALAWSNWTTATTRLYPVELEVPPPSR